MYIFKTIVLTIIFLIIIYIFLFRRTKQRKNSDFDSVKEYHDLYLNRTSNTRTSGTEQQNSKNSRGSSRIRLSGDSYSDYNRTNMVTKYNSSEDYREK